jgi:hypothetical protein
VKVIERVMKGKERKGERESRNKAKKRTGEEGRKREQK